MNRIGLGLRPRRKNQPAVETLGVASVFEPALDRLSLSLTDVRAREPIDFAVTELTVDGADLRIPLLGDAATSRELAATPKPGFVSGPAAVVSALTEPSEPNVLYYISYQILDASQLNSLYFAADSSPFAFQALPTTPGVHNVLAMATRAETASLLRLDGSASFGFVSCHKAQWTIDNFLSSQNEQLAATTDPGRISGAGAIVSTPTQALTPGETYVLSYEILADNGTDGLFTNYPGPFDFQRIPFSVGRHQLVLTAADTDTSAILNVNGDLTFGFLSLRQSRGSGTSQIYWTVRADTVTQSGDLVAEQLNAIFVAPTGSNTTGTGTRENPYLTPAAAIAAAVPGDTIYLRPGVYDPFMVNKSGTEGSPITISTLPGEEQQAIIRGDLQTNVVNGGSGRPNTSPLWRQGIRIEAQNYIHIRNLTVQDCSYEGIYIIGGPKGESYGHHVIAGCKTERTGNPGIMCCGFPPWQGRMPSESVPRTIDVLIEHNDVSFTNVLADWNQNLTNGDNDDVGGVDECITVSSSCGDIVTRNNDVHDSRQYGIDYKAGVLGGAIYGNRVWNIDRYAIYLDTGRNTIRDIDIYNNECWSCDMGIVLARESDESDMSTPEVGLNQSFINIRVWNNICRDHDKLGIYCQGHPGDGPNGEITNVSFRFNTIYNCNRSGSNNSLRLGDWADPDWASAGVTTNFDFIGNIVYSSDGPAGIIDEFTGRPEFNIDDNLFDVDPLFVDPQNQDLSLQTASPAHIVSETYATAPFDLDATGVVRSSPIGAGALARRP